MSHFPVKNVVFLYYKRLHFQDLKASFERLLLSLYLCQFKEKRYYQLIFSYITGSARPLKVMDPSSSCLSCLTVEQTAGQTNF